MKETRRVCLSCKELKALSTNLGACTNCRIRLFDNGGMAVMSMYNLYGFDKKTLKIMKESGELIPEINSDGNWRYPANTIKWYFVHNKDRLEGLLSQSDSSETEIIVTENFLKNIPDTTETSNRNLENDTLVGNATNNTLKEDRRLCMVCKKNAMTSLILGICDSCKNTVFNGAYVSSKDISNIYKISREELDKLNQTGLFKANYESGSKLFYSRSNLIAFLGHRELLSLSNKRSVPVSQIDDETGYSFKTVCEIKVSIIISLVIFQHEGQIKLCEKIRGFREDRLKSGLILPESLFKLVVKDFLKQGHSSQSDSVYTVETILKSSNTCIIISQSGEDEKQSLTIKTDILSRLLRAYSSL